MNDSEILAAYDSDLLRRGLRPVTRAIYLRAAGRFLSSVSKPLAEVKAEDVRRVLADLSRRVRSGSQASELSRIRAFLRSAVALEVIVVDPSEGLRVRPSARRPPVLLAREGIGRLLRAALDEQPYRKIPAAAARALALRDRATIEVLYATGLRASEVAAILTTDLDLVRASLVVRPAKRGPVRELPIPTASIAHLRVYAVEGRSVLADKWSRDGGHFLLSRRGRPLDGDMVWQIVERVAARAKVRAHPHALRRALATGLMREGVNAEAVRQVLGQARLSTTALYIEVDRAELHRAVASLDSAPRCRRS